MGTAPPLGAHLSVAGGLWRAVERAVDLGCTALQIFTQAPGRWRGREIGDEEVARFRTAVQDAALGGCVVAHTAYLINVASPDDDLWCRSVDLLARELERGRRLGLTGVVLHPGAHTGSGTDAGVERAATGISEALARVPGSPPLLIEVTAGQGTVLGSSFEEIAGILGRVPPRRVGVCWDTAHLWGAGWEITREHEWERLWDEFRSATGREGPDVVHLNDTNVALGSRKDRHERIGYGRLGEETFARIVRDPRLRETPMILETPKGPDGVSWDREALELLRGLATSPTDGG